MTMIIFDEAGNEFTNDAKEKKLLDKISVDYSNRIKKEKERVISEMPFGIPVGLKNKKKLDLEIHRPDERKRGSLCKKTGDET